MSNKLEILAPAGNREMLGAAVFSGADAVYLGLTGFNARRTAGNFTPDELKEAVSFCHARGVKVHVTLNTLVYDRELPGLADAVRAVAEAGADAVISDDLAAARMVKTIAPTLKGKKFAVVPILRAGLGLVDGVLRMVPSARVGHIGMFRDEETLEPHVYFCKMPKDIAERDIMIVDPMLATGGSAEAAITEMKKRGCKNIKLMVLLAAPEGVERIQKAHPDVDIYCGAVDDHLNEHGYIVPGLGDAGDRIFGTK